MQAASAPSRWTWGWRRVVWTGPLPGLNPGTHRHHQLPSGGSGGRHNVVLSAPEDHHAGTPRPEQPALCSLNIWEAVRSQPVGTVNTHYSVCVCVCVCVCLTVLQVELVEAQSFHQVPEGLRLKAGQGRVTHPPGGEEHTVLVYVPVQRRAATEAQQVSRVVRLTSRP